MLYEKSWKFPNDSSPSPSDATGTTRGLQRTSVPPQRRFAAPWPSTRHGSLQSLGQFGLGRGSTFRRLRLFCPWLEASRYAICAGQAIHSATGVLFASCQAHSFHRCPLAIGAPAIPIFSQNTCHNHLSETGLSSWSLRWDWMP